MLDYIKFYDSHLRNKKAELLDYQEIPFVEIRTDGTINRKGTEDFTSDRKKTLTLISYDVFIPTGKLDKGGNRRWECTDGVLFRVSKANVKLARKTIIKFLKIKHSSEAEISIRKCL